MRTKETSTQAEKISSEAMGLMYPLKLGIIIQLCKVNTEQNSFHDAYSCKTR